MSTVVLSVGPDAELREAAEVMHEQGVHRLLVMQEEELLGVISTRDLVRAIAEGQVGGERSQQVA
jgi:CBS domain-containing protein